MFLSRKQREKGDKIIPNDNEIFRVLWVNVMDHMTELTDLFDFTSSFINIKINAYDARTELVNMMSEVLFTLLFEDIVFIGYDRDGKYKIFEIFHVFNLEILL
jgi:hypothetical protein